VKVIGHKGGGAAVPENTATSLHHALHLGLDAVEIDIWPTADRQFVLFHDAHLGRITGHAGWTNSLTSEELRDLAFGSNPDERVLHERLLLLPEALDLIDGRLELVLEIKRTRHELERFAWVEEALWNTLCQHDVQERTTVISFDHRALYEIRQIAPAARIGMLFAGEWLCLWEEVDALAPSALIPHWAQTTPDLVSRAHQAGIEVYPWAVDHQEWMKRLMAMEVDGIITDHPEVLLNVLRRVAPQSVEQTEGGS
jgi:glycerophosphoryl diester phosphodiesterase